MGEQSGGGLGVLTGDAAAAVWTVDQGDQRRVEPAEAESRAGVQQQGALLSGHTMLFLIPGAWFETI